MELYPHQRKAVEELGNGKILCGDTGVGKTLTALAYYYEKVGGGTFGELGSMTAPVDIIVITTAKKRDSLDWQRDAAKFGISTKKELSVDGISITVDSWNNIQNYTEVENAFFVFDEQRVVGSGAWTKSFIKIARANRWILLSATPGDTWMDYVPVFIANGFYKNKTEFVNKHVVYSYFQKFPKIERYIATGQLVRQKNALLVEMPYARHTTRHIHMVDVDYDTDLFEKVTKKRWHVFEKRPLRDVAELFIVMRKVVNSDSSRLAAVGSLMQKHPRLIVFYNFDYELEALRTLADLQSMPLADSQATEACRTSTGVQPSNSGSNSGAKPTHTLREKTDVARLRKIAEHGLKSIPSTHDGKSDDAWEYLLSPEGMKENESNLSSLPGSVSGSTTSSAEERSESSTNARGQGSFAVAEWNGHKHEPIPETDRWVYLVQYVAGAEGWNCTSTDAVVFYSLTYSYKNFHQAMGRIDRMNTGFTDLHYYILRSWSMIDQAIWRALKAKKSFNERKSGIEFQIPAQKAA